MDPRDLAIAGLGGFAVARGMTMGRFASPPMIALGLVLALQVQSMPAAEEPAAPPPAAAPEVVPVAPAPTEAMSPPPAPLPLNDITVTALEPLYVAPTRRDRIGRIWAPVVINGQGPFRFVLATGASHSALTAQVATALKLPQDERNSVMLLGATGKSRVPMVPVESMEIGELLMLPRRLPIVPDALGGAQGILGTEGLANKRIYIDFRRDRISIRRSRGERVEVGFRVIPVSFMRGRLLVADAQISGIPIKAIIDTGGQATLGNVALQEELSARRKGLEHVDDKVTGATLDVQPGDRAATPTLYMGDVMVRNPAITFGDFAIFQHWKMTGKPMIIIGMDVLGLFDTLIIDYRRRELQVKLRDRSGRASLFGT